MQPPADQMRAEAVSDDVDTIPGSLLEPGQGKSKPPGDEPSKEWNQEGEDGKVAVFVVVDLNRRVLCLQQRLEAFLPMAESADAVNCNDEMPAASLNNSSGPNSRLAGET